MSNSLQSRGLQHPKLPCPWLPPRLCSNLRPLSRWCHSIDPSSIPGSGRSSREELGYPPQYSWASLVAQLVKNLPAMQETWVWSLGWEIPWRRERLPTPAFWPGEFHGLYSPWDHKESQNKVWMHKKKIYISLIVWLPYYCFSVTKLCPILRSPTDCNIPSFLVLDCLPEFV